MSLEKKIVEFFKSLQSEGIEGGKIEIVTSSGGMSKSIPKAHFGVPGTDSAEEVEERARTVGGEPQGLTSGGNVVDLRTRRPQDVKVFSASTPLDNLIKSPISSEEILKKISPKLHKEAKATVEEFRSEVGTSEAFVAKLIASKVGIPAEKVSEVLNWVHDDDKCEQLQKEGTEILKKNLVERIGKLMAKEDPKNK